jgi:hypothetical protein
MPDLIVVGTTIFVSTIIILSLHAVEWFQIVALPRRQVSTESTPSNSSSKLVILKGGLGVEAIYYFSLLIVFALFFSSNILFLTLIAALALAHLVRFQPS